MIDYQRIAEYLRDFRATPGQAVTDEVRRYATEYAQHVTQANERLRQCSVFLQQGLRSEAIHLADETPNLLELVAALDLPDAQGWVEFCQQHDLPVPPPLQIERAGRLNDAYGQEQPVEALLRTHRRLALCRAPVKQRLETMRLIAAADAGSGFWEKDVRVFEKARMKELKVAFATAMDLRDGQTLQSLAQEVLKTPWMETVSPDLLAAAQGTDDRIRLLAADARMRQLLGQIREAFAAKEHLACAALLRQIPQIVAETNMPGVSEDTAASLKPIIAWVRQEDEALQKREAQAKAQRSLVDALDADVPDAQLDACYQKLRGLAAPVPPELEERYRKALRGRRVASQRRFLVTLSGIAAVLVIAVFVIFHYSRQRVAAGWAERIHRASVARDVPLARQLIEEQERRVPQFNTDPRVGAAKQEVAQLEQSYDDDRKAVDKLLAMMGQDRQAGEKSLAAADAKIEDLITAARVAEQSAKGADSAQRYAWVDPDKKLLAAGEHLRTQAAQLQDAAEHKAQARAAALAERIDRAASPAAPGGADPMQMLDAIAAEAESLRAIVGLGKETGDQIAALGEKIAARRASLGKEMEQAQKLAALRRKATTVAAWKAALQEFVAAYPDLPRSKEFGKAIDSLEAAGTIESLQAVQQGWSDQLAVSSEAVARARLEKVKAYCSSFPRSPFRAAMERYANYLEQGAGAMAIKGSWQQGFGELLSSPLISELKSVTSVGGTRYYVLGDVKLKSGHMADREFISFETIDPANLTRRKTVTLFNSKLVDEHPTPLPHTKFAAALSAKLRQVSPENWDGFGITLIDEIAADREMDPVVRSIFLQQALQSTVQIAGWGLADVYGPAARAMARYEVENIVWYDLSQPVPEATLAALKHVAEGLPKPDVALKALRENKAKLFADVAGGFTGVGALMRDDAGAWTVCTSQPLAASPGSTVWAVGAAPQDANEPLPLLKVARYDGEKCVVDESAVRDLPEGTFVFVRK